MSHEKKVAGMARNLESKTGRTLDEWVALVHAEGPEDPKRFQTWLKRQGLGHFQARLVAKAAKENRE